MHTRSILFCNFSAFIGFLAFSCAFIPAAFAESPHKVFSGVCPPFYIKNQQGDIINPAKNQNIDLPYSPKQTCGTAGCHDYEKITKGYHFQQGKDEKPNKKFASLYQWVLSPGQYGGRW
jgi:hypothetical protein